MLNNCYINVYIVFVLLVKVIVLFNMEKGFDYKVVIVVFLCYVGWFTLKNYLSSLCSVSSFSRFIQRKIIIIIL